MNVASPVQPGIQQKTDWGSIAQLALSGLAFLAFLGLAVFVALSGISNLGKSASTANMLPTLTLALSYLLIAALLILSTGSAFLSLLAVRLPAWLDRTRQSLDRPLFFIILLWPLVLAAGYFIANIPSVSWFLLPVLHIMAVGLPIIWLVHLGRHGLPTGSLQRSLGVLSAGMAGSFFLAFIGELLAILAILIVGFIFLAANPNVLLQLNFLAQRLVNSRGDSEVILRALQPYLRNPVVIFVGLTFLSGLVPMIEELFKPLGVWLLGKRLLTPAAGFAAGILAGGGFALTESLGQIVTSTGSEWLQVELGRGGTDVLHILTAGLMGWALVRAWREGKYWQLGAMYLGVILLHGFWNALTLGIGLAPFLSFSPSSLPYYETLGIIAPLGLGILVVAMLLVLLRMNHLLRTGNMERTQNANY